MGVWFRAGGWFPTTVIIRLAQPSLAGVRVRAELGKKLIFIAFVCLTCVVLNV